MARKPEDKNYQEAVKRLNIITQRPDFLEAIKDFIRHWKQRGYPTVWFDKEVDWDEDKRRFVYHGLYYDLREICECYELKWPIDAGYMMQVLYALKDDQDPNQAVKPEDCPPVEQWRVWRIAREAINGFGSPTPDEMAKMKTFIGCEKVTFKTVTKTAILNLLSNDNEPSNVDERTIYNWITNCKNYLLNGGNKNKAIERAELSFLDWLELDAWIERQKDKKNRQNKS